MVPVAATATPVVLPTTTLILIIFGVTLGYLAFCVVWPFKACRRCRGMGRYHGPAGGIRLCRHCDATGLRLRFGRRIWNAGRRTYRDFKPRTNSRSRRSRG